MFLNKLFNVSLRPRPLAFFAFLALLIFVFNLRAVSAAAGDLDLTFAGVGALRLNNPHILGNIAIQSDGKILTSGSVRSGSYDNPVYTGYLVRFLPNGGYDSGFGANGFFRPQIGENFVNSFTFTLQPDDKIVVVGLFRQSSGSPYEIVIFRYHPNGQPDLTFGTDGVAMSSTPLIGTCGLLIQPDGKILLCGALPASTSSFDRNFLLLRFNPNGTPDTSFGNNGIVVPAADLQHSAYSTLLQADNKIIVSGRPPSANGSTRGFTAVRFLANGAVDTSFGTNGKIIFAQAGVAPVWYDSALQADGKLVMTGTLFGETFTPYKITLVRYTPDGQLDSSFGTNGVSITAINNRDAQPFSMLTQPNGKILVCGYNTLVPGYSGAALIARFNQSGTLDTSFGRGNGYVLTQYMTTYGGSRYYDMALQMDNKLVAVGDTTLDKYSTNAIIARYLINDAPDFDFDGDGKADVSIYRPDAAAAWYWQNSSTGQSSGVQFGISSDKPVAADFDGDGKTDIAVFRDGDWYRVNSSNNAFVGVHFGQSGDVPVPSDFDGDSKADLAVFRAGNWYILNSRDNSFRAEQFGISSDKPVIGDFDGDGKTDLAVFRDGIWYEMRSQTGFYGEQFGISTDKAVPADYDGDGKTDLAVFRPADGTWYLLRSQQGFTAFQFGIQTDLPAPADFDGDGKTDIAVYRDGNWYLQQSTSGFLAVQYGQTSDIPIPSVFVP